ncbi:MAG TPA: ABC transporter ATP-binding protein [Phycisphaerae bacterium]|nr:ABC transporter ATP-binding protein [Phycisphaerae bacterium]HNU45386.1 ABC transporter ATP-binding protein [Phycisphaerae bacterium]
MSLAAIELQGVSKWYGEVIGLNNVTTTIGSGITGLVGPNGAGKSTLMGLVTGQLHLSKGTLRVYGERAWDNPRVLRRLGYCPEGDTFWGYMSGRRFVGLLARLGGLTGAAVRQAVEHALELTGMAEHAHRAIRGYSKGMRQRIKLAQALVHRPDLLVLDEPFTGTDPVVRHELSTLLRQLANEGVDILISSHILHEVEALTSKILMIHHGRIVAEGDLHTVRRQMQDRPHAIRVRTDAPRRLAAHLAAWAEVTGVSVPDEDVLIVSTTKPEQVYDRLPELILREAVQVREIAAADESLEAVFGYLTAS